MLHRPAIGLEPMLPKSTSGTSGAARKDGTDTPPTHGGRAKRCARRHDLNVIFRDTPAAYRIWPTPGAPPQPRGRDLNPRLLDLPPDLPRDMTPKYHER